MPLTGYFIGDDSSLLPFVEIWRKKGNTVLGICSPDSRVRTFCLEHGLSYFSSYPLFKTQLLDSDPPHHLFSILNSQILSDDVLARPVKSPLNLHFGLSKYLGTNPTVWAILEGAEKHGYMWLKMIPNSVDAGEYLSRREFFVEESDDPESLALRCLSDAISQFPGLIEYLAREDSLFTSQLVADTRYIPLTTPIPRHGFLNFAESSIVELDRMHRALKSSGKSINGLTVPKLLLSDASGVMRAIMPLQMRIEARTEEEAEEVETVAGQVTEIDREHHKITISVKGGILSLSGFIDITTGEEWALDSLIDEFGIEKGKSFPCYEDAEMIGSYAEWMASHHLTERYWVQQLRRSAPYSVPFIEDSYHRREGDGESTVTSVEMTKTIPAALQRRIAGAFETMELSYQWLLAMFAVYLSRIIHSDELSLWVSLPEHQALAKKHVLLSPYVPVIFSSSDLKTKTFAETVGFVKNQLAQVLKKGSFDRDLLLRYPSFRGRWPILPIAIIIGDEKIPPLSEAQLILHISKEGRFLKFSAAPSDVSQFSRAVDRMFSHLVELLDKGLQAPSITCDHLPMLLVDERERVDQLSAPSLDLPDDKKTVINFFEMAANSSPMHSALVAGELSKNYRQLMSDVDSMARYLQHTCHVVKGDHVIVALPPTFLSVICLLAVMKVGGVYIPVIPGISKDYLSSIIRKTGAKRILCEQENKRLYEELGTLIAGLPGDCLSRDKEDFIPEEAFRPVEIDYADLAYVVFTSGTTGEPKGVKITHQNLMSSMLARLKVYHESEDSFFTRTSGFSMNVLLVLAQAFDAGIATTLWPLMMGGTLTLVSTEDRDNPAKLLSIIKESMPNTLICVPAFFQKLLYVAASSDKEALSVLRLVVLGGDRITGELVRYVHDYWKSIDAKGRERVLYEEYGPSEGTVWCSYSPLIRQKEGRFDVVSRVTLGKAAPNCQLFLLDTAGQPVPPGVVGEICLAGSHVALGYAGEEELTSKKFPSVNIDEKTIRIYRTGDLGVLTDIGLEFRGRADQQVKIRGHRIELEHLQKVLVENPVIQECVIGVKKDPLSGEESLVAFVTLHSERSCFFDENTLMTELSKRLPLYMLPTRIIALSYFPLTQNKKIDVRALLESAIPARRAMEVKHPPETDVQKTIANIWTQILPGGHHSDHFDVKDHTFEEYGGDSMTLVRMWQMLKRIYPDLKLPSIKVTISALAETLSGCEARMDIFNPCEDDLRLEESITLLAEAAPSSPRLSGGKRTVLLTGATGFLGAHILVDLSQREDVEQIICLVRGDSFENAKGRFFSAVYDTWNITDEAVRRRIGSNLIKVVRGDLREINCFGVSKEEWGILASTVTDIIHAGAEVNHIRSYESLKDPNVESVRLLLKLAVTERPKTLHFVSTLGAVLLDEDFERVPEEFLRADSSLSSLETGYSQTKAVAEILLTQAATRGIAVTISRPGWIFGHSKTGVVPRQDNHLIELLRYCIKTKTAPNWDMVVNLIPVDIAASLIVGQALDQRDKRVCHLLLEQFEINWRDLIVGSGDISVIEAEEWRAGLKEVSESDPFYPFVGHYLGKESVFPAVPFESVETHNTLGVCASLRLDSPEISTVISLCTRRLIRSPAGDLAPAPPETPSLRSGHMRRGPGSGLFAHPAASPARGVVPSSPFGGPGVCPK